MKWLTLVAISRGPTLRVGKWSNYQNRVIRMSFSRQGLIIAVPAHHACADDGLAGDQRPVVNFACVGEMAPLIICVTSVAFGPEQALRWLVFLLTWTLFMSGVWVESRLAST